MCKYDFFSICFVSANQDIESFFGFSEFMSALALIFVIVYITKNKANADINSEKPKNDSISGLAETKQIEKKSYLHNIIYLLELMLIN